MMRERVNASGTEDNYSTTTTTPEYLMFYFNCNLQFISTQNMSRYCCGSSWFVVTHKFIWFAAVSSGSSGERMVIPTESMMPDLI